MEMGGGGGGERGGERERGGGGGRGDLAAMVSSALWGARGAPHNT